MRCAKAAHRYGLHASRSTIVPDVDTGQTVKGIGNVGHSHRLHTLAGQIEQRRGTRHLPADPLRDHLEFLQIPAGGVRRLICGAAFGNRHTECRDAY